MQINEVLKIKGYVRNLYEFYGKADACNDLALDIFVDTLQDYEYEVVCEALRRVVKVSKFMPRPCEIVELIERMRGGQHSPEFMELHAGRVFRYLIKHLDIGEDIVSDDWRLVYAVNMAFTSLLELGRSTDDNVWLEKKFVKAYMLADDPKRFGFVLKGMFHTSTPRVRFIGEPSKCEAIAQHYYPSHGIQPRLPNRAVERKPYMLSFKDASHDTDDAKPVSAEEIKQGLNEIMRVFCGRV